MNGKERFLCALGLGVPDAVPTYVHAMNEASILRVGRLFTERLPELKPVAQMTAQERMQLAFALMQIHQELDIDGITAVPIDPEERIDDERFKDPWGVVRQRNPHGMAVPVGYPIASEQDLERYQRPHPDPTSSVFVAKLMKGRLGKDKALVFMAHGIFTKSWYLHGMQQTLIAFIRNPELVRRLARMATDHCCELIDLAAGAGVDVVIMDDDIADKNNPFISPKHYREIIWPFHREVVEHAKSLGLKIILHTDGNIWPLLEHFVEAGFDGINPLEPYAKMDLGEVKKAYGDRICLVGNIDCGELLCSGSVAEVEEAVEQAIAAASPNGGYILCDSNSIHPGVEPENFIAMMKAAKRFNPYAQETTS